MTLSLPLVFGIFISSSALPSYRLSCSLTFRSSTSRPSPNSESACSMTDIIPTCKSASYKTNKFKFPWTFRSLAMQSCTGRLIRRCNNKCMLRILLTSTIPSFWATSYHEFNIAMHREVGHQQKEIIRDLLIVSSFRSRWSVCGLDRAETQTYRRLMPASVFL